MIVKVEIRGDTAYLFSAPDKPMGTVPADRVAARFGNSHTSGWFDVKVTDGKVTEIGERVSKPKDWP